MSPASRPRRAAKPADLTVRRRLQQHLTTTGLARPEDVVEWFGAVQAQDYFGAVWAVGQRTRNATQAIIEAALNQGRIVRSWPMRGTIHLMRARDVHWMMEHFAPRAMRGLAGRQERHYGLDAAVLSRSRKTIIGALEGGRQVARPALYQRLEQAGISAAGQRGFHILARLALEGLICFGPREGRQPTFALLDEWVPDRDRKSRDEALGTLAGRYFTSHGPATRRDFAWWSGLTIRDATAAIHLAGRSLSEENLEGVSYWCGTVQPRPRSTPPELHLLPAFDEYGVAYRDRSAILPVRAGSGSVLVPSIVHGGVVAGSWTRSLLNGKVIVKIRPFRQLPSTARSSLERAAERYARFMGAPVTLR